MPSEYGDHGRDRRFEGEVRDFQSELAYEAGRGFPDRKPVDANPDCLSCIPGRPGYMKVGALEMYCNCLYDNP